MELLTMKTNAKFAYELQMLKELKIKLILDGDDDDNGAVVTIENVGWFWHKGKSTWNKMMYAKRNESTNRWNTTIYSLYNNIKTKQLRNFKGYNCVIHIIRYKSDRNINTFRNRYGQYYIINFMATYTRFTNTLTAQSNKNDSWLKHAPHWHWQKHWYCHCHCHWHWHHIDTSKYKNGKLFIFTFYTATFQKLKLIY